MALFHRATITPTKAELLSDWAPTRSWWGAAAGDSLEVVGAFRFDDPEGRVGIETHLVTDGSRVYQVPLTYREEPLPDADDAFICEMQHSALGTRWVYDGLGDQRYLVMLAAVAMTGQGEAIGMVEYDGRWYVAPSSIRIEGGGWTTERVAVDDFRVSNDDPSLPTLENDRFRLTVYRQPTTTPRPPMGLSARGGGLGDPVLLAHVEER